VLHHRLACTLIQTLKPCIKTDNETFIKDNCTNNIAIQLGTKNSPHASCDYFTPALAHGKGGILKKQWSKNSTKISVLTNAN
jgi:hypothetical protein